MRFLTILLVLLLATPALADQKTETVTAITTSATVVTARPSRPNLLVMNIGTTNPAFCCFTACPCVTATGMFLAASGGSVSFGLDDNMTGLACCVSVGTTIYALETWR